MVQKKAKSKRLSLHKKYKIQKKVREHQRKLRREAKKNPSLRKKLKKEPGIPNLCPYKEDLLHKMETQKQRYEEEKEKQKKRRQLVVQQKRMEDVVQEANQRAQEFEMEQAEANEKIASMFQIKDNSKKAFYREFKKIVEIADVILEVLDARDPLGCRCVDVERKILAKDPNKKIILVLNKIDLIPRENLEKWLKYLRNELPTIAFKCSTQEKDISQSSANVLKSESKNLLQTRECLGAETLLQLLKNYCRSSNLKTTISVGIIGYPNVGKSSLINSLKRSKAVGVGSTPGLTKALQEIHLDKNIKLLDCPGIVFASDASDDDIALRNCIKIEQIEDPTGPVEAILKRCQVSHLMQLYKIPSFSNASEFLIQIAFKRGKLGKGGVPNLKQAAKTVLQDWNSGKIPYCTVPPKTPNVHISSEIVSSWSKEFDIESILQQEASIISTLPEMSEEDFMTIESKNAVSDLNYLRDEDEESEDSMDEKESEDEMEDENKKSTVTKKKKTVSLEEQLNPQTNKQIKLQQKKMRKKKKKQAQINDEDDSYDFSMDFFQATTLGSDDDEEEEEDREEDDDSDIDLNDI